MFNMPPLHNLLVIILLCQFNTLINKANGQGDPLGVYNQCDRQRVGTFCMGVKNDVMVYEGGTGCFLTIDCDCFVVSEKDKSGTDDFHWNVLTANFPAFEIRFFMSKTRYTDAANLPPPSIMVIGTTSQLNEITVNGRVSATVETWRPQGFDGDGDQFGGYPFEAGGRIYYEGPLVSGRNIHFPRLQPYVFEIDLISDALFAHIYYDGKIFSTPSAIDAFLSGDTPLGPAPTVRPPRTTRATTLAPTVPGETRPPPPTRGPRPPRPSRPPGPPGTTKVTMKPSTDETPAVAAASSDDKGFPWWWILLALLLLLGLVFTVIAVSKKKNTGKHIAPLAMANSSAFGSRSVMVDGSSAAGGSSVSGLRSQFNNGASSVGGSQVSGQRSQFSGAASRVGESQVSGLRSQYSPAASGAAASQVGGLRSQYSAAGGNQAASGVGPGLRSQFSAANSTAGSRASDLRSRLANQ